ncbi:MAG TPA: YciI family protein [Streptosporangiaceae bacterium]|nr:YciI family protein [Streptosporangiaceae bacterium]
MRYFGFTPSDPSAPPPTPDLYERMGEFMEEASKAGVLLVAGGLGPSEESFRVKLADGEYTLTDGPFTEAKELVGGWGVLDCRDKAEAVEWVKRFLAVGGGGESTVWPIQ